MSEERWSGATVVVARGDLHRLLLALMPHAPKAVKPAARVTGRGLIRLSAGGGYLVGMVVDKTGDRVVAARAQLLEAADESTGVLLDGDGFGHVWLERFALEPLVLALGMSEANVVHVSTVRSPLRLEVVESDVLTAAWRMVVPARDLSDSPECVDAARVLLTAAMSRVDDVASVVVDRDDVVRIAATADVFDDLPSGCCAGPFMVWGRSRRVADRESGPEVLPGSMWLAVSRLTGAEQAGACSERCAYRGEFSYPLSECVLPLAGEEPSEKAALEYARFVDEVEAFVAGEDAGRVGGVL